MSQTPPADSSRPAIDRRRYRQVRWFFFKLFLSLVWHDLVLALPVLRLLRGEPLPRWCGYARRYRALAVELGGVLIKLGQFLSARVDVLPIEVTRELAGLQDEVPAAPFDAIAAQIEADLGQPLDALFAAIEPTALGAASLAQAHAARLPDGRPVVVKVLRPGIQVLVETDLKAIGVAIRWLRGWRFVRRRVDLEWLIEEFTTTTRNELDLAREGRSAERLAADFADDPLVRVPAIVWPTSGGSTLTEENVAFVKVSDLDGLDAAGIDRKALATALYQCYMRQIFVHHFVHADPHPGNLFVRPLRGDGDPEGFAMTPGAPVPPGRGRPFTIHFVDFGMVAEIPERLRDALRDYIIGIGNRDAGAVIQAYVKAGVLLPGADLVQLEEALETVFDRFWGVEMSRLSGLLQREAANLWREFSRLLLDTPIQLQVDLLFATRAIELLNGVATQLDPDFNPWIETMPFARTLAAGQAPAWRDEAWRQVQQLAALPADTARVMAQARRGQLAVKTTLGPDARRQLARLEQRLERLTGTVTAAALLIAGALLVETDARLGGGLMAAAAVLWVGGRLLRWLT